MGNYALFNIEHFDDIFPRLVIQVENSLVFRDVVVLNLLACTCDSRIFISRQFRVKREGGLVLLTESR